VTFMNSRTELPCVTGQILLKVSPKGDICGFPPQIESLVGRSKPCVEVNGQAVAISDNQAPIWSWTGLWKPVTPFALTWTCRCTIGSGERECAGNGIGSYRGRCC